MSRADVQNSESALAERVRWLRQQRGWTLEQAGRACVVATSSLSKIENGLSSPTYDVLLRIAKGFSVDVAELFMPAREHMGAGRRTIERADMGKRHDTPMYEHRVLCSQLANKRMMPFITRIKAHEIEKDEGWSQHDGEEFVYVLKGSIELHTEFYQPAILHTGDCFYIDSRMLHRVVNHDEIDAEVMWISTKPELHEY